MFLTRYTDCALLSKDTKVAEPTYSQPSSDDNKEDNGYTYIYVLLAVK
jgi:hypothetical protein